MSRLKLIVETPTYYSEGDELAFFKWLKSISAVASVTGSGSELHITLSRQPRNADLRELVGLFYRYEMNMKPLAALRTSRNAKWFAENPAAFWRDRVFGVPGKK